VYPAVLLMYFISAAVILLASLALMVQDSLPYNKQAYSWNKKVYLVKPVKNPYKSHCGMIVN